MSGYDPNLDFFALLRPSVGSQLVRRMPVLDLVMSAFGQSGLVGLYVGYTPPAVNQASTMWLLPQNPSWQGPGTLMLWDQTQNNGAGGYVPATPLLFGRLLNAQLPPFSNTQSGIVNAVGAGNTSAYYIGGDNAPHPMPGVHSGLYINQQRFMTVGTAIYTPTLGTNFVIVRALGGGGGGGGAAATSPSQGASAGGGAAGGFAQKWITSNFAGLTVTVGAGGTAAPPGPNPGGTGGTSSFGTLVSATGGTGGIGANAGTQTAVLGGIGGQGSNGDLNIHGQSGIAGVVYTFAMVRGGAGGSSIFGPGAVGSATGTSATGSPGTGYGAGGSGGVNGASQANIAGSVGSQGIVIVDEYA